VLARIRATAVAAVAPDIMGMGPVPASRKALARAGLTATVNRDTVLTNDTNSRPRNVRRGTPMWYHNDTNI